MNKKTFILFFFFVLIDISLIGQNTPIKFKHLTSKKGLSQATVPFIYKDKLGWMWFATFDGLNKYDGTQMTTYRPVDEDRYSISNHVIKKIYEDHQANLWITTADGLNFLDRKTNQFTRFYHEENNPNSLSHNHLTEIIGDQQGNLWIGTLKGYLNKYHLPSKQFTIYPPPTIDDQVGKKIEDINYLYLDRQDNLWIAYLSGEVVLFDKNTGKYTLIKELSSDKEIWCLREDKRGNFWVGTDGEGLKLWDRTSRCVRQFVHDENNPRSLSNNIIWSMAEDNDGQLLLGTEKGLNILALDDLKNAEVNFKKIEHDPLNIHGLNSDFIRYVYHDPSDNITWLGTTETGVDIWNRKIQQFIHYHDNGKKTNEGSVNVLNHQVVWSIWDDQNAYTWVGTSAGLNRLHRLSGEVNFYFPNPNDPKSISPGRCWNILKESETVYWIGTSTGLNKMTLDKNNHPSFQLFKGTEGDTISSNSIRSIYQDKTGTFWVGTNKGLNIFDPMNNTFQTFYKDDKNPRSISNNYIRSIMQDRQGRLWIATSEGLNRYHKDTQTFSALFHDEHDPHSLSHSQIRCLLEDKKGNLWVGTSSGLNKMLEQNGQMTFKHFTEKNGLPNNTIYALEEDANGRIWISTNAGLSCFDPILERCTNFDETDGLQDVEFNSNACFKNKNGELFFGGVNGLNVFNPQKIYRDTTYPKVLLTEFRLNNQIVSPQQSDILETDVSLAKHIYLTYQDKLFSIKYAALTFSETENQQYAYFLKGWDENWNEVGHQTIATYTNIPPGDYEFQVKTSNQNGEWNVIPTTIALHIQPAFWQTNWFKLLAISFLILGTFLFYRRRVLRLKATQVVLETRVKERTEELNIQKEKLEKTSEDLHRQNQKLEKAYTDLKNAQAQLLQSEKMASLGQLTAGIAHEINNPINFVAANIHALKLDFNDIQLIMDKIKYLPPHENAQEQLISLVQLYQEIDLDFLNEEINNLINGIEKGVERTQNIVNSLHTFSRNANDEFAPADLHEGLNSTLTILKSQFRDRITLHKDYGDIPLVNCQMGKINQVFLNIINNAIHAIEGEGDIFIKTEKVKDNILVRIQDTGKGIPPEDIKHIFEPFFTTKEVGQGTGLGMTISYHIMEQHHGSMEVNSEVGKGTEFVICLPI